MALAWHLLPEHRKALILPGGEAFWQATGLDKHCSLAEDGQKGSQGPCSPGLGTKIVHWPITTPTKETLHLAGEILGQETPITLDPDTDPRSSKTMGFSRSRNWGTCLAESDLGSWCGGGFLSLGYRFAHLVDGGKWAERKIQAQLIPEPLRPIRFESSTLPPPLPCQP